MEPHQAPAFKYRQSARPRPAIDRDAAVILIVFHRDGRRDIGRGKNLHPEPRSACLILLIPFLERDKLLFRQRQFWIWRGLKYRLQSFSLAGRLWKWKGTEQGLDVTAKADHAADLPVLRQAIVLDVQDKIPAFVAHEIELRPLFKLCLVDHSCGEFEHDASRLDLFQDPGDAGHVAGWGRGKQNLRMRHLATDDIVYVVSRIQLKVRSVDKLRVAVNFTAEGRFESGVFESEACAADS